MIEASPSTGRSQGLAAMLCPPKVTHLRPAPCPCHDHINEIMRKAKQIRLDCKAPVHNSQQSCDHSWRRRLMLRANSTTKWQPPCTDRWRPAIKRAKWQSKRATHVLRSILHFEFGRTSHCRIIFGQARTLQSHRHFSMTE